MDSADRVNQLAKEILDNLMHGKTPIYDRGVMAILSGQPNVDGITPQIYKAAFNKAEKQLLTLHGGLPTKPEHYHF